MFLEPILEHRASLQAPALLAWQSAQRPRACSQCGPPTHSIVQNELRFPVQGDSGHRGLGQRVLLNILCRVRGDSGDGEQGPGQDFKHLGEEAKSRVKALKWQRKGHPPS